MFDTILAELNDLKKEATVPNIEVHGIWDEKVSAFTRQFVTKLRSVLYASIPRDFLDEVVITTVCDNVEDLKGNSQPFIRLFTTFSDSDGSKKNNFEILCKVLNELADLEILPLSDFRPKKK